jgi:thioredoxin 1
LSLYSSKHTRTLRLHFVWQAFCKKEFKKPYEILQIITDMKNQLHVSFVLLLLLAGCARSTSPFVAHQISWKDINQVQLNQVLQEAASQQKIVFVDVYASWCGPCKWMDKNVFNQNKVMNVLEEKFINFRVDGENFDGADLRVKYNVAMYPTYLFLSPDGRVLRRLEGSMKPETLVREAESVLSLATNK